MGKTLNEESANSVSVTQRLVCLAREAPYEYSHPLNHRITIRVHPSHTRKH